MSRYLLLTLSALLAGVGCQSGDETYARAMQIESLDQAIGGPKASAREGDRRGYGRVAPAALRRESARRTGRPTTLSKPAPVSSTTKRSALSWMA